MAGRFGGELKWIDPKLLIDETNHNRLESFFLGLGVAFNDLKGLLLFGNMLDELYERPSKDEITSHAGNYGGIVIQIQKLFAGTLNELLIFLKKNSDVSSSVEFKEILNRLSKQDKQLWEGMIAVAYGKLPNTENLLKTIVKIRSNVAFHFDHSGKILRNAYISRFFGKTEDEKAKYAYYSIDDNIELTRFYFSDASVEESLQIAAGKKPKENSVGDIFIEKYQDQLRKTIVVICITMKSLLKNYIQLRRNRPH